MFHYTLDHRLDREGFFADALVELVAEPAATTTNLYISDRPELAHEEVGIVHKLLVRRPDGSLPLLPPLNGSLFLLVVDIDLHHGWEVDLVVWCDHDPRELLFLFTICI